jgi:hypothetical protein
LVYPIKYAGSNEISTGRVKQIQRVTRIIKTSHFIRKLPSALKMNELFAQNPELLSCIALASIF